ncbi:hypothetical protein [Croceicoccus naphthovorans]|uniref:Uncharacterized protein n=1 Tax=Croceicoccus naphthovorans TaxID=1348774 RepID=A0A0G3XLE7_9SPHN|nr:hypothetical protein [Croceicoccus naphthovorans]AKM11243.1 hypothetical protein AB433_16705 [Croceicoccus naphthovorans]MBB3989851.1 hypothetical protein [Croceicoccus naphthovorans]
MRKAPILTAAIAAATVLSGCTASRYQISDALQRYGLSSSEAGCASEFLRGQLSTGQVNRLSDAARYYNAAGPLTFGNLIAVATSLDDPEVLLQVGGAAAACGLLADTPIPGL